jgi:endonuclease/exonuclease/phosphatase family metal-dependent hydrolase
VYKYFISFTIFGLFPAFFVHSENMPFDTLNKYMSTFEKVQREQKVNSGLLSIISYNTWGLPINLSGHDQERRFTNMGSAILDVQADIVALQETFHPELRSTLLQDLHKHYYTYSDYRSSRSIWGLAQMDLHGGLMTLSKYPIASEMFFPYPVNESTSFIEKAGAKGFLLSKIKFGEQYVFVVNTHLYAGNHPKAEYQRKLQMEYMHQTLNQLGLQDETIVLVGDFNIHHPCVAQSEVYDVITKDFQYVDSKPTITDEDYTMDNIKNPFVNQKEPRTKLDYIFTSSGFAAKYEIVNQARTMTHENPFSDHFGWRVDVKLKS